MVKFPLLRSSASHSVVALASCALVGLVLAAQPVAEASCQGEAPESGAGVSRRLMRVEAEPGPGGLAGVEAPSPDQWRAGLMDADLGAREGHFAALRRAALESAELRRAVESWTQVPAEASAERRELAWSARLLLGELKRCCANCGHDGSGRRVGLPNWFDGAGADPFAELREQLGRLQDSWGGRFGAGSNQGEPGQPGASTPTRALRTDILGVVVQRAVDVPEGTAAGEQAGLWVDRVVGGTIAAVLGVRRGDRLLTLNGTPLEKAADVTRILAARKPSEELRLTWTDSRGRACERAWRESGPRGEDGVRPQD